MVSEIKAISESANLEIFPYNPSLFYNSKAFQGLSPKLLTF